MSTTDLQGNITYANDAFVEASGYSYDELIGQPHRMVRHPDMPKVAFKDFWQTIQQVTQSACEMEQLHQSISKQVGFKSVV